jgi:hypothetical protein
MVICARAICPFNSRLGDAHVVGDFGVGVTGLMRKIDLSSPRVARVQKRSDLIQTLLAIDNWIWSRTRGYEGTVSINLVDRYFEV